MLFQVPKPGTTDPSACGEPVVEPDCFSDVSDLGADDIAAGRDHGIPSYNELRVRTGSRRSARSRSSRASAPTRSRKPRISRKGSTSTTRRSSTSSGSRTTTATRSSWAIPTTPSRASARTTLAARLKALYGSVDKVDAFVGMVAEQHVAGTEFGPLQLAIWKQQFAALRDGDRFFYLNDPALGRIDDRYGITYRHTLAQIVELNTDTAVPSDVFHAD